MKCPSTDFGPSTKHTIATNYGGRSPGEHLRAAAAAALCVAESLRSVSGGRPRNDGRGQREARHGAARQVERAEQRPGQREACRAGFPAAERARRRSCRRDATPPDRQHQLQLPAQALRKRARSIHLAAGPYERRSARRCGPLIGKQHVVAPAVVGWRRDGSTSGGRGQPPQQSAAARRRRSTQTLRIAAADLPQTSLASSALLRHSPDMKLHVAAFLALLLAAFFSEGGSAPRPDPRWLCESLRCPPIVSPVCGVDDTGELRTFRTACHMELALCHEKKYFVMLKPGEC
ncbi:uncharacterized protein LOC126282995 [Schistocerca gregaria]|uniref:uncharacterized protein LOC126282995 n=1 Tax=Schistocerca gregaria TaxID=7010 RepID=UPI00211EB67E|nr:uncharacterized protein LOC126282995 [Schistocerca gregaria]